MCEIMDINGFRRELETIISGLLQLSDFMLGFYATEYVYFFRRFTLRSHLIYEDLPGVQPKEFTQVSVAGLQ